MRTIVPRSAGPWLVVVTLTAAGVAAAVGYGLTAPKHYRATAQLLVAPVAVNDPTFMGLDVLRDTGGRRTAAATAAALLRSPQVADQVRAQLGLRRSRDSLLAALHPHVVDSSDVVAVTVEDTSAAGAAQLANAFADALVKQRTAGFQSQLATTIRRDTQLLDAIPLGKRTTGAGAALDERLTALHGFEGQPDPTIRHAGEASAPVTAVWPKLPRFAATGAAAGLAAGVLVVLLLVLGRFGRRRGAAELALEAAELEQAERERLVEPEPEPEPEPEQAVVHAAAPPPGPASPAVDQTSGRWNLLVLERLINERGEEFPEHREEWSSYLYFLREYAEPDGSVSASFDGLIQDTFSDLVA